MVESRIKWELTGDVIVPYGLVEQPNARYDHGDPYCAYYLTFYISRAARGTMYPI